MREALPHVLQQVAEIAGLEAALRLAQAKGGHRIYVPKSPTAKFEAAIGDKAAAALCELYGGEHLEIPFGPHGTIQAARRAAERAISQGMTVAAAASLSGLTERSIYARKAKRREQLQANQGRLFDD